MATVDCQLAPTAALSRRCQVGVYAPQPPCVVACRCCSPAGGTLPAPVHTQGLPAASHVGWPPPCTYLYTLCSQSCFDARLADSSDAMRLAGSADPLASGLLP